MQKIISRSLLIHKFISRYSNAHKYEMVLYNEKPQTCTSLVVRFDKNKDQPYDLKTVNSTKSRSLSLFKSSHFVLHTNGRINIPVIEERIDSDETPEIKFVDIVKWLAKTPDSDDKDVSPGARIGRLDAANEAGFFHRTERSRLKNIKKTLKDKVETEPTEPKKAK